MLKKGLNMEELKNRNIRSVLSYLRTYGPSSRKTIAGNLNLTTASLTNLTNELIKDGFIIELGEVSEGKVGRKQVLVDLNPESRISLGLEVRDKKVTFVATDIKGEILQSQEWDLKKELTIDELEQIIKYIEGYISDKREKVLGIGLLVPGYIEDDLSRNIELKNIKNIVEDKLKVKTIMENNIRALVGAELYLEKKYNNFWLVSYGPGVGSAIVLNGKILLGNKKKSGEIGHIPLTSRKKNRYCKICNQEGCLESEIRLDSNFYDELLKNKDYKEIHENLDVLAKYISIGYSLLDPEKLILSGRVFAINELYKYLVDKIHFYNSLINKEDIEYMRDYDYKRKVAGAVLVLAEFFK